MRCGSWSNTVHRGSERSGKPAPTRRTSSSAISAMPTLRRQAVAALATHGSMALAMLDKYAPDPDFREILRTHGAAIIPAIAQADAGPETLAYLGAKTRRSFTESLALAALFASGDNGQATIRTIKNDGLERVAQLNQSEIQFYQFLPLYDVIHLGNVVRPRLLADLERDDVGAGRRLFRDRRRLEPGGRPARGSDRRRVDPHRGQGRGTRGGPIRGPRARRDRSRVRRQGRGSATEAASGLEHVGAAGSASLSRRWARWWTVRSAGGLYQVMRQIPEALPRLSLAQMTEMAGPLAAKAGMRLSAWKPIRLLKDGTEVVLSIPPQRGLKYLSAQAIQAGVGVVGFQKMEEHLASRRPRRS